MNLKDLLEELKATTIETQEDTVLILEKNGSGIYVRYSENTDKYEIHNFDISFFNTALSEYVTFEDDDDEEPFEMLYDVPEEELLKHLPSIFAFEEYTISVE